MHIGWSSLGNTFFFIMPFDQKKQHLWYSCQISLVISNMKLNHKLSEEFWRIRFFPFKKIGAALACLDCMPGLDLNPVSKLIYLAVHLLNERCATSDESRFKDGRWVTWLVLKRLWYVTPLLFPIKVWCHWPLYVPNRKCRDWFSGFLRLSF